MKDALIIIAIIQTITSAYGLSVIESVRPLVENRLREQGYVKNKNSLYTFSNTISDVLKCFVPLYYFVKAINIISNKGDVDKQAKEKIDNKSYINPADIPPVQVIEDNQSDSIVKEPEIIFEKPEKYKARKSDVTIYDTYETPVEYITREATPEDDLELSPFVSENKVVQHVVLKDEVSKKDIAKAITELSPEELDALNDKIIYLADAKRKNQIELKLEKDVA